MKKNFKSKSNIKSLGITQIEMIIAFLVIILIILFIIVPIINRIINRAKTTENTVNLTNIQELAQKLEINYTEYLFDNNGKKPDSKQWPIFMEDALNEFVNTKITGCVITDFTDGKLIFEDCKIGDNTYKYHYSSGAEKVE